MAKPIFLIRIPKSLNMSKEVITDISKQLDLKFNNEYHIVAFICQFAKQVDFECYNVETQNEIKVDDLKKYVRLMMTQNPALL